MLERQGRACPDLRLLSEDREHTPVHVGGGVESGPGENRWCDVDDSDAIYLSAGLAGIDDLTLPPDDDGIDQAWYLYVVRSSWREALAAHLEGRGVETGVHYDPRVHQQPPYCSMDATAGEYPNAEQWAAEFLSLPVHPHLTDEEVAYVVDAVREFFDA